MSGGLPRYVQVRTGDFDDADDGGQRKGGGGGGVNVVGRAFSTGGSQGRGDVAAGGAMSALQLKMREQDDNLDILGSSVSRLGDLSLNMSKEIELQNRMLDSLEADTDSARDKVDILTKKTKEIIQKSGGPRTFCLIVVLVLILLVLTLLVIYT